jgi:hypothetical protein
MRLNAVGIGRLMRTSNALRPAAPVAARVATRASTEVTLGVR